MQSATLSQAVILHCTWVYRETPPRRTCVLLGMLRKSGPQRENKLEVQ